MICSAYGHTRQGYYKHMQIRVRTHVENEQVLSKVIEIRKKQPMVGTRKLKRMLDECSELSIGISRDRLFALLCSKGMLVKRKRRYIRTTDSDHAFRLYPNLLPEAVITGPCQAIVSDITYLKTRTGYAYLFLNTDYYSRKIIGYHVSDNLTAKGAIAALRMAIRNVSCPAGMIHHSDHGIQYCSRNYRVLLKRYQMNISMTGNNHCYDNAIAERVNGILKQEFRLGGILQNLLHAKEAVEDAVSIYNRERLHLSLGYRTPNEVYAA